MEYAWDVYCSLVQRFPGQFHCTRMALMECISLRRVAFRPCYPLFCLLLGFSLFDLSDARVPSLNWWALEQVCHMRAWCCFGPVRSELVLMDDLCTTSF